MFNGIIEAIGEIREVHAEGSNRQFWISSPISAELRVDQSVSHDGVCLTVDQLSPGMHRVTAIAETLKKSILDNWKPGVFVNVERSMLLNRRLDGHFVQGHVDTVAICQKRKELTGSREFTFSFDSKYAELLIEKGSIAINGISLTVFSVKNKTFKVAIIPYTFEHTNMGKLQKDSSVNVEFDLLGKFIVRQLRLFKSPKTAQKAK